MAAAISAAARSSNPRRFRHPVRGSLRELSASALCWRSWLRACQALIAPAHASTTVKSVCSLALDPPTPIASARYAHTVRPPTVATEASGYVVAANTTGTKKIRESGLAVPPSASVTPAIRTRSSIDQPRKKTSRRRLRTMRARQPRYSRAAEGRQAEQRCEQRAVGATPRQYDVDATGRAQDVGEPHARR